MRVEAIIWGMYLCSFSNLGINRNATKDSCGSVGGKLVGVHGAVIGRYEREEVKPSIEMATQLTEVLEVSLDYLVGSTDVLLEKNIVSKILDIQKLKENDRQHVFALLDAFLKQTKLQSIL